MPDFKPVMPHGPIQEVFEDVFFVTGTTRPEFMNRTWQFSRSMTIIREDGALTLVNTVRLDDEGLEGLDSLGKVTNVVRLGAFHGMDDAFYVDRYGARLWALPGTEHNHGLKTDVELEVGGTTPVKGASLFRFASCEQPEGLLLLDREGGILIACDSLQNWVETDQFFDAESAAIMREQGFIKPANIGPGWKMSCNPAASDFAAIKSLAFRHLLSAHGVPLRDEAHALLSATFADQYGV